MEDEVVTKSQPSIADMIKDADAIASKTISDFISAYTSKKDREDIALRAHYNFNGMYNPVFSNQSTTSKAFVQVTRPRVQTAISMILPVLLPPGNDDDCWTITPSPKPSMPGLAAQLAADGMPEAQIRTVIAATADAAADELSIEVKDGFAETKFPVKLHPLVFDSACYGTGIGAGPFVREKKEDGSYTYDFEWVSFWDAYPDPAGYTVNDLGYMIERRSLNAFQMKELTKKPGFNVEAIEELLSRYGDAGNWCPQWWESSVNRINGNDVAMAQNRYELLIRWGFLSGKDIAATGAEIPEDRLNDQIMCQAWVCGGKCLFVGESEIHKDRVPYYFVPYTLVPRSIWGAGVPEMMFDSQDAVNACERSTMDNMAMISGPQVTVFVDRLMPGHNNLDIYPKKIWPMMSSEVNTTQRPVDFWTPQVALNEIRTVKGDSLNLIQEQTFLPNFLMGMGGQGTHNRTAEGATLQFNTASTPMKGVIFNFENNLIIPLVQKWADAVKMTSTDEALKGDHKVIAKGLTGLMAREAMAGKVMQFMQIAGTNPAWAEQVDMDRIFQLLTRAEGLQDERVTLPYSTVMQRKQEQQQMMAQQEQQQIEMKHEMEQKTRAETAPRDAMLEAMKQAPDEGPLKLTLIDKSLEMYGLVDPEIKASIEAQEKLEGYKMQAQAEQMAMNPMGTNRNLSVSTGNEMGGM